MNEPQIGILNLSSHQNYLRDVGKIAKEIGPVSIFTTSRIYEQVENISSLSPDQWVTKQRAESQRKYLNRVEQRINEDIDFLISFPFYGHIVDYTKYARFNPDCEYLLYSFDLNGMIGRNPTFTPKIYNYLKYPLKEVILRRIDRLLVEFSPLAEYVASKNMLVDVSSFTPTLYPGSGELNCSTNERTGQDSELITVTTPGMIDSTRRDYNELLEALNALPESRLKRIKLVLLGKPVGKYGSTIIKRAKRLQSDGMKLEYYMDWIPTDVFANKMDTTDILVSPLRRQRPVDGFVEQYGQSKGSGAISDAISYRTPLLIPSWFNVPERTEPGIHTYEDNTELQTMLTKLIENNNQRWEWYSNARKMAQRYLKHKQSERLRQVMKKTRLASDK